MEVIIENWCTETFFNPTDAAYLWLDLEPQDGTPPRCVKSIYKILQLEVDCSIHAEECFIQSIGHKHDLAFGEDSGNLGYSRTDLIEYAKRTGKKPLFLFPENLKKVETPKSSRYQPSSIKREAGKLKTQEKYKGWRKAYQRLKKSDPHQSGTWIAKKISRMDIGKGNSYKYILRNMKQ